MKNLDEITLEIKQVIRVQLINCSCQYRGLNKNIVKFREWWKKGIEFIEKFNLSEVPVAGLVTVSVEFDALVLFDIDGNQKGQSYVNGHFGPITISFADNEYDLDYSQATISRLTTQ